MDEHGVDMSKHGRDAVRVPGRESRGEDGIKEMESKRWNQRDGIKEMAALQGERGSGCVIVSLAPHLEREPRRARCRARAGGLRGTRARGGG